jgi:hypothetical protein
MREKQTRLPQNRGMKPKINSKIERVKGLDFSQGGVEICKGVLVNGWKGIVEID